MATVTIHATKLEVRPAKKLTRQAHDEFMRAWRDVEARMKARRAMPPELQFELALPKPDVDLHQHMLACNLMTVRLLPGESA